MSTPRRSDVILRGSPSTGFTLLDAATRQRIAGPTRLRAAIDLAKQLGAMQLWQEMLDEHGRSRGVTIRIPLARE